MTYLAIIGGTGLNQLEGINIIKKRVMRTPYGEPSGPMTYGEYNGKEILFLPRHGVGHTIPPHKINYCANIWALKESGISKVLGVAAVGGINPAMKPSQLVIPNQIIDYTWGRESTFHDGSSEKLEHIDFTEPYSKALRTEIILAGKKAGIDLHESATYGATQGPRLESAAEIDRMERDGCDLVGMTGMPEAALARELSLEYTCCAVIANPAAGRGSAGITMHEIEKQLSKGMLKVRKLLTEVLAAES